MSAAASVPEADRRSLHRRSEDGLTERLLRASIDIRNRGVRTGRINARHDIMAALSAAGMYDALELVMGLPI